MSANILADIVRQPAARTMPLIEIEFRLHGRCELNDVRLILRLLRVVKALDWQFGSTRAAGNGRWQPIRRPKKPESLLPKPKRGQRVVCGELLTAS